MKSNLQIPNKKAPPPPLPPKYRVNRAMSDRCNSSMAYSDGPGLNYRSNFSECTPPNLNAAMYHGFCPYQSSSMISCQAPGCCPQISRPSSQCGSINYSPFTNSCMQASSDIYGSCASSDTHHTCFSVPMHQVPYGYRYPENPQYTPSPRIPRPIICPSPYLELRDEDEFKNTHIVSMKSQIYKRLVEQNLERLSQLAKARMERLRETRSLLAGDIQSRAFEAYVINENRHLRSLRTKMRVNDFETKGYIGGGFASEVFLVRKRDDNNNDGRMIDGPFFAMKRLSKKEVKEKNLVHTAMVERDALATINTEWIVKLFFSFQDEEYLYFILEYVPGGDLMSLLISKGIFDENMARFYMAEISLAVQFVHDANIIHRDIKPDNILIDKNGHIKLADFGLCTGFKYNHDPKYYQDDSSKSRIDPYEEHPTLTGQMITMNLNYDRNKQQANSAIVGSENYMAPEVFLMNYNRLCDWWSVGIILYEMVIGSCPNPTICREIDQFQRKQNRSIFESEVRAIYNLWFVSVSSRLQDSYERGLQRCTVELIRDLLAMPNERLCRDNGLADMKDHRFFDGIDWENIRNSKAPFIPIPNYNYNNDNIQHASRDFSRLGNNTQMHLEFTYTIHESELNKK